METNQESIKTNNNELYEKPMMEIIEMEMESCILAGSGDDFNPGGGWGN